MKKYLILFFVCLTTMLSAQRRSVNLNDPPNVVEAPRTGHAIGLVFSTTMGNGLAYRYWKKRVGYHTAIFPFAAGNVTYVSWGNALYYTLKEFQSTNRFIFQVSADYAYRSSEYTGPNPSRRRSNALNIGCGPGIETHSRYGSFTFHFGYGFYNRIGIEGVESRTEAWPSIGMSYFFEI